MLDRVHLFCTRQSTTLICTLPYKECTESSFFFHMRWVCTRFCQAAYKLPMADAPQVPSLRKHYTWRSFPRNMARRPSGPFGKKPLWVWDVPKRLVGAQKPGTEPTDPDDVSKTKGTLIDSHCEEANMRMLFLYVRFS